MSLLMRLIVFFRVSSWKMCRVALAMIMLCTFSGAAVAESDDYLAAEKQTGPGYGKLLFGARCTMCHQLPDPQMLNVNQWKVVINKMQKRMALKSIPLLPQNEIDDILAYLKLKARP